MKKGLAISLIAMFAVVAIILGALYYTNNREKNEEIALLSDDISKKTSQISTLNSSITSKTEEIQTLTKNMSEKDALIADLNTDVKNKKTTIEELNANIQSKNETIEKLNSNIGSKSTQIETLTAEIENKEKEISNLNEDVSSKSLEIETLNAEISTNKEQIESLITDNNDKADHINTLNVMINAKDSQIKYLKKDTDDKKATITALKKDLRERDKTIKELNEIVADKTTQIQELYATITKKNDEISKLKEDNDKQNVQTRNSSLSDASKDGGMEPQQSQTNYGFDPSTYSSKELEQIMVSMSSYRSNAKEGDIIYNKNGVKIEYRGVIKEYDHGYVIVLFVENNSKDAIYVELDKALLDRAALTISNAGSGSIEANSIWISTTGSCSFILYTNVLSDYGITHGTNLECTFSINDSNYRIIDTIDLKLTVDMTP